MRRACASCSTAQTLQHRERLGLERSLVRRSGCRGAAGASRRSRCVVAQRCALTIHSSRTRFVAWFKCVAVPLPQLTDQQVAGRLNSGVRPHKAVQHVWRHRRCCCSTASAGFWFVAAARSSRFGEFPCSCVEPALRGFVVATSRRRDCSSVVGSSGRRYGYRGAASASLAVRLASASAAP